MTLVDPTPQFLARLKLRLFRRKVAAAVILEELTFPDVDPAWARAALSDLYVVARAPQARGADEAPSQ